MLSLVIDFIYYQYFFEFDFLRYLYLKKKNKTNTSSEDKVPHAVYLSSWNVVASIMK